MRSRLPVLVVEDDRRDQEALIAALGGAGITLILVETGEEAKELLCLRQFSAVLINLNLPGMGGIALLGWCKATVPHVPIFIVTGMEDPVKRREATAAGAQHFFVKPFHHRDNLVLLNAIAQMQAAVKRANDLAPKRQSKPTLASVMLALAGAACLGASGLLGLSSRHPMEYITDIVNSVTGQMDKWPIGVLVVVVSILMGWVMKRIEFIPNRLIPVGVILTATLLNAVLGDPAAVSYAIGPIWQRYIVLSIYGFIYGFVAWGLHAAVLKKLGALIPGWADEQPESDKKP